MIKCKSMLFARGCPWYTGWIMGLSKLLSFSLEDSDIRSEERVYVGSNQCQWGSLRGGIHGLKIHNIQCDSLMGVMNFQSSETIRHRQPLTSVYTLIFIICDPSTADNWFYVVTEFNTVCVCQQAFLAHTDLIVLSHPSQIIEECVDGKYPPDTQWVFPCSCLLHSFAGCKTSCFVFLHWCNFSMLWTSQGVAYFMLLTLVSFFSPHPQFHNWIPFSSSFCYLLQMRSSLWAFLRCMFCHSFTPMSLACRVKVPTYVINLDAEPSERWNQLGKEKGEEVSVIFWCVLERYECICPISLKKLPWYTLKDLLQKAGILWFSTCAIHDFHLRIDPLLSK